MFRLLDARRRRALLVALLLVSVFACCSARAATRPPIHVTYAAHVVVKKEFADLTSTITVRTPATAPDMREFRRAPSGSLRHAAALTRLFSAYGSIDAVLVRDALPLRTPGRRLRVAIHAGTATLSLSLGASEASLWNLAVQRRTRLSRGYVTVTFPPVKAAAGRRIDLTLSLVGSRLDYARPTPSSETFDGRLGWTFARQMRTQRIEVSARPGPRREASLVEPFPWQAVVRAGLGWGTPLLLLGLVFWALRPSARADASSAARRARRLAGFAFVVMLVSFGSVLVADVGGWWASQTTRRFVEREQLIQICRAALPTTLVVGLAFAARARALAVALGVLAGAGLAMAAVAAGDDRFYLPRWHLASLGPVAVGATTSVALFATLCATLVGRTFRTTCPELADAAGRIPFLRAKRRVVAVSATVVAALWLIDVYRQWHAAQGHFSFARRVVERSLYAPGTLTTLTAVTLVLLTGVATAYALWSDGSADSGLPLTVRGWKRIMTTLFAGWIVGLEGSIDGYPAPFPFVFSLLTFPVFLWVVTRRPLACPAPSPTERRELLKRAAEAEAISARQRDLYESYRERPAATPDEYFRDQAALEAQREGATGDVAADARRVALGVGPEGVWWKNARVAARYGLVAGVPPVVFTIYVVLTTRVPRDVHRFATLDFAWAATFLAEQAFLWLLAAALLGALYAYLPGGTAMAKAAAVWLAFLVPNLVGGLLIDPGKGVRWPFTAAELGLFIAALGVALDLRTLKSGRIYWRHLQDLYRLHTARALAAYGVPVLVLLGTVLQQVATGDAKSAISEVLKNAPGLLTRSH